MKKADTKDNSIIIRLSDEELRQLNDGWFKAVSIAGRPLTKSEYIRKCISFAFKYFHDFEEIEEA